MRLRAATIADAAALTALFIAARRTAMPYLPDLHSPDETLEWMRSIVLELSDVTVAEFYGEPAGFVAVVGTSIEHIYVAPTRQGRGVGAALLREVQGRALGELQLHVFQRNVAARAFYERHGFQLASLHDGADNEEHEPDAVYRWVSGSGIRERRVMRSYVLVLPLAPLQIGDIFSRRNWPLHVTIVGNFSTESSVDDLVRALEPAAKNQQALALDPLILGEQALFGAGRDVVVNVVADENHQLASLHALLLESIGGLVELFEPHHALSGYRPHVTAVPPAITREGDRFELHSLALVDLDWFGDESLTKVVWATGRG